MLSTSEAYNELNNYLKTCKVTENDPAILFDWNLDVLEVLVNGINHNAGGGPQAFFISSPAGHMTQTSLLNDIMLNLANVSGGRHGNNLLAPNTLNQALNILRLLSLIETNPWFQQHFHRHIPHGSYLCTVSQIIDRRIANATPCGLVALPGFYQIFQ